MQTPDAGLDLERQPVTFTWSAGTGATAYWLDIGKRCRWQSVLPVGQSG